MIINKQNHKFPKFKEGFLSYNTWKTIKKLKYRIKSIKFKKFKTYIILKRHCKIRFLKILIYNFKSQK